MKILVINAGSSSLKYQLFDMKTRTVLAKGLAERIGIDGSNLTHKPADGNNVSFSQPMPNHTRAITLVMEALTSPEHGVLQSMDEVSAIGHRVLHGGQRYSQSVLIDEDVLDAIRENIPLGPLHNPANLQGIEACMAVMPGKPQVAVFDTAFHQSMPPKAYLYGIDYEYYKRLKIRRYGFHGTSHRYVSQQTAKLIGRPLSELKIITCHLGNGSSLAAVSGGKCVDTSMGLTPLEGVLMGTRSGDMDPAVLQFIMNTDGVGIDEMLNILNKKSGLLGVSGFSSDMRDVLTAAEDGHERAQITVDMFCYRIRKYIGAYAAAMGGVDAIVFTAGIGENNPKLRKQICNGLDYMGITIDDELNSKKSSEDRVVSKSDSRVKTCLVSTNEELMIAQDTLALTQCIL